jgi:hypothetical protein
VGHSALQSFNGEKFCSPGPLQIRGVKSLAARRPK